MAIESTAAAATTTGAAPSSLNKTRKSIAGNFDTFLSILTTQLRNQNPLEPLDTNQFTQQLVQFTSVEQQLKTNEFLEALVLGNKTNSGGAAAEATQAVGLIGKSIIATTSTAELKGGAAKWTYTASSDAPNAEITVRDSKGTIVFQKQSAATAGLNTFAWDGRDISGLQLQDGNYSISIDARDNSGKPVLVLTQVKGTVASVDLSGPKPMLTVNGARFPLESVLSVSATAAA
jgi:flagellar basal-body rod modification protein FlgD